MRQGRIGRGAAQGAEAFPGPGARLLERLRSPLYWAGILLVSLPYMWNKHLEAVYIGLDAHPVLYWVRVVGIMPAVLASYVVLAPVPWQCRLRGAGTPGLLVGAAQALLFCEGWTALLVLLDALIPLSLGLDANLANVLTENLMILGPAAMVVGGLIAGSERKELHRQEAEARAEAVQARANEAQSRLLQSQLHPHVLFNALNGLTELVRRDPVAAEEGMLALSELLRLLLKATEKATFRLSDERLILEDYLAIERMRLGARLDIAWEWDAASAALIVPPLLLQPLVENAVKHGISKHKRGGRLIVEVRRSEAQGPLYLRVRNTGKPLGPSRAGGVGVRNIQERLGLLFQEEATLRLYAEGEWTVAEIELSAAAVGSLNDGHAGDPGR